jgi:hypothetical protein
MADDDLRMDPSENPNWKSPPSLATLITVRINSLNSGIKNHV